MDRETIRRGLLAPLLTTLILLATAAAAQAGTISVNTTADAAASQTECSGVAGDCSLRQAIDKAQPNDIVALPGSTDNPAVYTITLGTLSVNKSIAIEGNGPQAAIVDGSGNDDSQGSSRIVTVSGGQVTIKGLTLRNGSDDNDEQFRFCSPCETLNANGGGALFNNGSSVALDNVAFTNDSAPVGGAVSNSGGGTMTMTDVSFTGNGGSIGGALFTHSGSVTGTGVTFEDNGSGSFGGGAAYLAGGTVNLTNATIVGNGWASSRGGGIENADATLTLVNDTFSGNLRGAIQTDNGATSVGNTIIGAGFSDGVDFGCVAAGEPTDTDVTTSKAITTDLGGNLDEDGHCGLSDPSDRSGSADLAPIADNGGPTRTQALLAGSPALGDPSTSPNCPSADQRGVGRPSGSCDIGAFEAVLFGAPTATTGDVGVITDSSAKVAGTINLQGEAGGFHFIYGTSQDDLSNRSDEVATGVVSADTTATDTLSGLTPDTTYFFKTVADNASGSTAASAVESFTTQPGPPVIGDQPTVDSITDTAATVHFSINPQGSDTTYFVAYGPGQNYGQQTQPVDIGSAPGAQDLSVQLTGLNPGSAVHFAIVASNDVEQNVQTDDRSFDTLQGITGIAGQPVTVTDSGDTFTCPSPDNTTVDWADDSSDTGAQIQCGDDGEDGTDFQLTDSHIYTAPGTYKIVIDYGDLGGQTDVIAHISANPDGLTNTATPVISGSTIQGQTLTTDNGGWDGTTLGFDYQWLDCDENGQNCSNTGSDQNTYTLGPDDVGQTIRVIVTASNDHGSSQSQSDPTGLVSGGGSPPTNTGLPKITGVAQQGNTLTTSDGTWDGGPGHFDYQWQDCDSGGQHCTNTGTDTTTYALTSSDVGHTIRVIVTATNDSGPTQSTSDPTAVVAAAAGSPPPNPPAQPTQSSPTVGAANAQTVTVTSAGFSGSVTPNGLPTQAHFEYGLDPRYSGGGPIVYDHSTPDQPVGSDFASHGVGPVAISGLLPNALYHVRLVAVNGDGTTLGPDATFTTAAARAPSPPTVGKTVNITPVSGFVLIKIDGKFVPLTGAEQIPAGSVIDARHGTLELITSTGQKGKTQHGTFGGAIFKITQAHNGLATLKLIEAAFKGAPSYALCKAHKAADATIASSKTLQLLKASAHGKFRTSGRYSAATVRGTIWTVADRCDGTLTHVITDSVAVTDFVHHKTIILHAGQSYLAKPHRTP